MASLVWPKTGKHRPYILVVVDGSRKRVSLSSIPKLTKAIGRETTRRVELISASYHGNMSIDAETATWLGGVTAEFYDELAKHGLVEPRKATKEKERITVETLVDRFIKTKSASVEASSKKRMSIELDRFKLWAGLKTEIESFTVGSATDFHSWLAESIESEAAQRTCCRYVKAAFNYAVEHEWIARNPFLKLKSSSIPASRQHYVTPDQSRQILSAIDKHFGDDKQSAVQWKALFGLARFAGLRATSETHAITWQGVDWANNALIVPVKKTRRFASKRVVPIVPELKPILKAAEAYSDGAGPIITLSSFNLARKFPAILKAGGIDVWPDLFQTLRQSCETHLVALGHPQHAVSQWLGHSERVSKDHYLMVTSESFKDATTTAAKVDAGRSEQVRAKVRAASSTHGARKEILDGVALGEECSKYQGKTRKIGVARAGIEPATHGFSVRNSVPKNHNENHGNAAKHGDFDESCAQKCAHLASVGDSSVELILLPDNLSKAEINTIQGLANYISGLPEDQRLDRMRYLETFPQISDSTIALSRAFHSREQGKPVFATDQAATTENT